MVKSSQQEGLPMKVVDTWERNDEKFTRKLLIYDELQWRIRLAEDFYVKYAI